MIFSSLGKDFLSTSLFDLLSTANNSTTIPKATPVSLAFSVVISKPGLALKLASQQTPVPQLMTPQNTIYSKTTVSAPNHTFGEGLMSLGAMDSSSSGGIAGAGATGSGANPSNTVGGTTGIDGTDGESGEAGGDGGD